MVAEPFLPDGVCFPHTAYEPESDKVVHFGLHLVEMARRANTIVVCLVDRLRQMEDGAGPVHPRMKAYRDSFFRQFTVCLCFFLRDSLF